ncbi:MAG: hypothetical protein R3D29_10875 [Nitratireductor sp.]
MGQGSSRASASGGSSLLVVLLAVIAIAAGSYIAWDKLLSGKSGISLQASLDAKDVELANRRQPRLAEKLATESSSVMPHRLPPCVGSCHKTKELIAELQAQLDNGNGDQIPRLESNWLTVTRRLLKTRRRLQSCSRIELRATGCNRS